MKRWAAAILLSLARYTAPADRSLRFYREYFGADRVVEIDKQRRRWRIVYQGEEFAVNIDRLIDQAEEGPYLEIKSRTWSRRDATTSARARPCASTALTRVDDVPTSTVTTCDPRATERSAISVRARRVEPVALARLAPEDDRDETHDEQRD